MPETTHLPSADLVHLRSDGFDAFVGQGKQPALVEFGAEWCGPCRMQAPILRELAREFAGRARVGAVDVDADPALAARYGIRSLPTLAFFKDGEIRSTRVGLATKATLAAELGALA